MRPGARPGWVTTACDWLFELLFCTPLAPVAYLCTAPVAELYFLILTRRFVHKQQLRSHATFSPFSDAADAANCWMVLLREGPDATWSIIRAYIVGDVRLPVRRDNLAEFIAWNMFNVELTVLDQEQAETVEAMVGCFEVVIGRLPPGREPGLTCVRYTLGARGASPGSLPVAA
jgi:hypothetical protein